MPRSVCGAGRTKPNCSLFGERRIACRYRLTSGITLWPFDVVGAEYFASAGPLQALGVPTESDVVAGLRLTLTHRMANSVELEVPDAEAMKQPDVAKRIADFNVTAVGYSPAETAALIKKESELYRALIAATGIKVEK